MEEINNNLVLEQLRIIRNDTATFKQQTEENFHLVHVRLSAVGQHMASLIATIPTYSEKVHSLVQRVARIERRLDRVGEAP